MRFVSIGVLAVAVLVSGCINVQESGFRDKENNTVFYTDSGFKPSKILIEKGETVRWVDRSSRKMWVASDVHPRHSEYSGTTTRSHCGSNSTNAFDQCSGGEIYEFRFGKEGTWSYHNHLYAYHGGAVKVK